MLMRLEGEYLVEVQGILLLCNNNSNPNSITDHNIKNITTM